MTLKKFIRREGSAILLNPAAFASVEKIDSNPNKYPFYFQPCYTYDYTIYPLSNL